MSTSGWVTTAVLVYGAVLVVVALAGTVRFFGFAVTWLLDRNPAARARGLNAFAQSEPDPILRRQLESLIDRHPDVAWQVRSGHVSLAQASGSSQVSDP